MKILHSDPWSRRTLVSLSSSPLWRSAGMMTLIDGPILIKFWIGSVRSWAGKYMVMNSINVQELLLLRGGPYFKETSYFYNSTPMRFFGWNLGWCYISNTKDRVWPHFRTPSRELKIRRVTEYFCRISRSMFKNMVKHCLECLLDLINQK